MSLAEEHTVSKKPSIGEWALVLSVYLTLTLLVWGLFGFDRGYWQDEPQILHLINSQPSGLGQLFTLIASPTRVLMAVPYTLAQWSGIPLGMLQGMYGLTWLITGLLAHLLASRLFPHQQLLSYTTGSLTLAATGDFSTNYLGVLGILISIAFYFAAVLCFLGWWRNHGLRRLGCGMICLSLCIWMYDAALPVILLTPGLFWVLNDFRLSRRLFIDSLLWYLPVIPYLIFFVSFLFNKTGYAEIAFVPLTPLQRIKRALDLFAHNFTPWEWALNRKQWFPAPTPLLANQLRIAITLGGVIVFLGAALWLLRKHRAAEWDRLPPYRLHAIAGACLLMALASNAGYASVRFSDLLFRTQLVSRVWASLAIALLAYWVATFVLRRPVLMLVVPAIFVGFGTFGGLERQDYFLGYWRRQQAELRSIVEPIPGLKPDTQVLLTLPPGSIYPATEANYRTRAWFSYLYGDPTLANRVFLWDASCKAEREAFICGGANSLACLDSAQCSPTVLPFSRLLVLRYLNDRNRFAIQDNLPPGLLHDIDVADKSSYNPRAHIINGTLPSYAQALLYGPQYLGSLLPGEPALPSQPFVQVDSSLATFGDLEVHSNTPWPIETYDTHQSLWLGNGQAEGLTGTVWSVDTRTIHLTFDVEPGPGRADSQRTAELTFTGAGRARTERRQFDRAAILDFTVVVQPGRNSFNFSILEQVTVPVQQNGDKRHLLVLLRQVAMKSVADQSNLCSATFADGWHQLEGSSNGWLRWTSGQGQIHVFATKDMQATMDGELYSIQQENELDITLNGEPLQTIDIDWPLFRPFKPMTFRLRAGDNTIVFLSHNAPITTPADSRPLAVAVKNLRLITDDGGTVCALQQ